MHPVSEQHYVATGLSDLLAYKLDELLGWIAQRVTAASSDN